MGSLLIDMVGVLGHRAVVSEAASVLCRGLEMVVVCLRVILRIGAAAEWL